MKDRIMIGKIGVDRMTKKQVLTQIHLWVSQQTPALLVTPYSEMVVYAEKDENFMHSISQADLTVADGVGMLWAGMYLNTPGGFLRSLCKVPARHVDLYQNLTEQVRGSELIYDICDLADTQTLRIYLCGGRPEVIQLFIQKCDKDYPNIVVSGSFSQKITEKTNQQDIFQEILESRSDIILMNLSTPLQEKWGAGLRAFLKNSEGKGVILCFGGSLDMLVGFQPAVPHFFRWVGLEWFWRLIRDPSRIRRIYRAIIEFPLLMRQYKQNH